MIIIVIYNFRVNVFNNILNIIFHPPPHFLKFIIVKWISFQLNKFGLEINFDIDFTNTELGFQINEIFRIFILGGLLEDDCLLKWPAEEKKVGHLHCYGPFLELVAFGNLDDFTNTVERR